MLRLTLLCLLLATTSLAQAQTAPSAGEIAAYEGLHRAAHTGQVDDIRRLAKAGASLNARDAHGRTPAHVAAFASHDEALRALAKAGADMNALDNQAYDVVTIAAVADDADRQSGVRVHS